MQYKPYPTASKPVAQERGPAPQSVAKAVKLMYAGAAVSTVALVVTLIAIGGVKDAIRKHYPHYTPSHVNQLYTQYIEYVVFTSAFAILLWLVMAWANGKGMSWARIASTVLFVLFTLELFASLRLAGIGIGIIFAILTWLVGVGAVVLLWRPDSNAYFKPQKYLLSAGCPDCGKGREPCGVGTRLMV